MDFAPLLVPYAWLWWTMAMLYNPGVAAMQSVAPNLQPWQGHIRRLGLWNASFAMFSLMGFTYTHRCVCIVPQHPSCVPAAAKQHLNMC